MPKIIPKWISLDTSNPSLEDNSGKLRVKVDGTTIERGASGLNVKDNLYVPQTYLDTDINLAANSDVKIATQKAVKTYIDALLAANDAMVFKGTVGSGGTYEIAAFNSLATYQTGHAYKIVEGGTVKGKACEIGDMVIATVDRAGSGNLDGDWIVVQANLDGAVTGPSSATSAAIAIFSGVSGKVIANSGHTMDVVWHKTYMHKITAAEVTAGKFALPTGFISASYLSALVVGGIELTSAHRVESTGAMPDYKIVSEHFCFKTATAGETVSEILGENDIVVLHGNNSVSL